MKFTIKEGSLHDACKLADVSTETTVVYVSYDPAEQVVAELTRIPAKLLTVEFDPEDTLTEIIHTLLFRLDGHTNVTIVTSVPDIANALKEIYSR